MQTVRLVSTKDPRKTKDVAPRYVATLIKLGLYRYPDAAVAATLRPDAPSRTSKAMTAEDGKGGSRTKREYKRRDMRAEE